MIALKPEFAAVAIAPSALTIALLTGGRTVAVVTPQGFPYTVRSLRKASYRLEDRISGAITYFHAIADLRLHLERS